MNNKPTAYYTALCCTALLSLGLLSACGSDTKLDADRDPIPDPDPGPAPSLSVQLQAPEYLISGETYELIAEVPQSSNLTEARWQIAHDNGQFVYLSNQKVGTVLMRETFRPSKTFQTRQEVTRVRFFATDDQGATGAQALEIPIFEKPLHVGAAMTVQTGTTVALTMVLDAEYQQQISGEFDTTLWTQVEGPDVTLQAPNSAATAFSAPLVEEITKLRFLAQASASATAKTFTAEKVVYLVPQNDWVEAVAIHNGGGLRVVLRADGSLLLYGAQVAPHNRLLQVDFDPETVKDIGGSLHSAFVLFNDGTAKTLYMRPVTDGDREDPLKDVTGIQAISGTRYPDARDLNYYLLDTSDLYLIQTDQDNLLRGQNIAGILPGIAGLQFNNFGQIVNPATQEIIIDKVRKASASNRRIAYILQDGTVGHTELKFPEDHFQNHNLYADVQFSNFECGQVFVTRTDNQVEALTANSHPLSPDVVDIKSLSTNCGVNMALKQDGTVVAWPGAYNFETAFEEFLMGEKPAPWNIRGPIETP